MKIEFYNVLVSNRVFDILASKDFSLIARYGIEMILSSRFSVSENIAYRMFYAKDADPVIVYQCEVSKLVSHVYNQLQTVNVTGLPPESFVDVQLNKLLQIVEI